MSTAPPSVFRVRWRDRVLIVVVAWVIRALYASWRVRVVGYEHVERLRAQRQSFIYTLWHGELLPLLAHHQRQQKVAVLISEHRDGERIAQVVMRLGMRTVRGSTSRGAARALLGLVRELENGGEIAITPDGPRGPLHHVAPGTLVAAHRAGVPVMPVRVHASSAWRLRSWDAFMIPKPFAKLTVAYGEEIAIDAPDARAAAEQTTAIEARMAETLTLATRAS